MNAPTRFVNQLTDTFDGQVRIRWSESLREWHLEQKVGHGFGLAPCAIDDGDDALIRARDGYHFIMAVRDGDRMPCPKCGLEVRVPVRETWDVRCGFCQLQGRTTRFVVGYWPLDDSLITHLKKINPRGDYQDQLAAEADYHNRLLMESQVNDAANPGEAEAEQLFNRLVGIPQVGYTGREYQA